VNCKKTTSLSGSEETALWKWFSNGATFTPGGSWRHSGGYVRFLNIYLKSLRCTGDLPRVSSPNVSWDQLQRPATQKKKGKAVWIMEEYLKWVSIKKKIYKKLFNKYSIKYKCKFLNFHPSIHYQYRFILIRVAGALERRQGTPWTGRQSIAEFLNLILYILFIRHWGPSAVF